MRKILVFCLAASACGYLSCNTNQEAGPSEAAKKNLEAAHVVNKAFQTGDVSGIDSAVAADFVDHTDHGDANRDSLKTMIKMIKQEFPDMKSETIKELADDEYVFSLERYTGTSSGSMGMPKGPYDMHSMQVIKFKDGKAVEHWEYALMSEMAKMMQQSNMGGAAMKSDTAR